MNFSIPDTIIEEFLSLNGGLNIDNYLVIILGEGKKCPISRYFWDYEKKNNLTIKIVSIDPVFHEWSGCRQPKKIRESLIGRGAEKVRIVDVLKHNLKHNLKNKLVDKISSQILQGILLISINAHTHAGKFLDRIITSAPKIYGDISISALCSWCHNPGLYKRQIKSTLKYPIIRRTDPIKHRGWLLNVDVY